MILYSIEHNFALISPPKNACVTLRYWFDYLERGKSERLAEIFLRPFGNIHRKCELIYSRQSDEIVDKVGISRIYFVVRNPWIRLASAYFEKIQSLQFEIVKLGLPGLENRPETIREFIAYLGAIEKYKSMEEVDPHFRTQTSFCQEIKPEKLIRMESLQSDFNKMCEELALPSVKLPNWKTNLRRKARYENLFTEAEAHMVGDIYRKDCDYGVYSCPEYMIRVKSG